MSKKASAAKKSVDSPARKAQKKEIIETATAIVASGNGLTMSLEHLNFESIVKDSGVPRSSAYRLWPDGREGFFRDLLLELSGPSWAKAAAFDHETVRLGREVVARRFGELGTLEGRRSVLEEAVRVGVRQNYEALFVDARWRTYLALNAATFSLADESLQDEIKQRLRDTERQFLSYMAVFYEQVAVVLGLELKDEFTFKDLALAGASVVEGLALRRLLSLDTPEREFCLEGCEDPWSMAAVGFLGVLFQMVDFVDDYDPAAALQQYLEMMATFDQLGLGD